MPTKGELTKEKILDTARVMLWKNNYHGITVDMIVQQAGVNKASFYNYFSSKEELASLAIQKNYEYTREFIYDAAFAKTSNPIERLELIFKGVYRGHKKVYKEESNSPGCPFVNMGIELAFENEKIRIAVSKIFSGFYKYWAEIYKDTKSLGLTVKELEPNSMGKRLHSVLNGAMVSSRIHKRPEDILDAINTAKAVLGVE